MTHRPPLTPPPALQPRQPLSPPRPHCLRRLMAFAIETHPPLVYALVSASWAYSVMGWLQPPGSALPHSAALVAVVFFLILLYLRAIDEIKDLPYDRVHHPERPLVRGAVSTTEVARFAAAVAAAVLALCASLSPTMAAWAALQMAYGVGLLVLERRWARFRISVLLNLCITFPVSAALNVLAWRYVVARSTEPSALPSTALIATTVAAHVAMFLHMELGRKLSWPQHTPPGEHSYSTALGLRPSVALCIGLGLLACALATTVLAQRGAGLWSALPALALLLSAQGLRQLMSSRNGEPHALKPWFGGAMVVFYGLSAWVAA